MTQRTHTWGRRRRCQTKEPWWLPNRPQFSASLLVQGLGLLFLGLLFLADPAQADADRSVTKTYSLAQARYHTLEFSPSLAQERQNWQTYINDLERAYQLNPQHNSAPNILFSQGEAYTQMAKRFNDQADVDRAQAAFASLMTKYPGHSLAETAQTIVKKSKAESPVTSAPSPTPASPAATAPGRPAEVVNVRHWTTKQYTRVVIETSAPTTFSGHLLKGADGSRKRLYINLPNCQLTIKARQPIEVKDGLLHQVRSAQFDKETVRVVLDARHIADYAIASLDNPFRVIVDVKGSTDAKLPPLPETTPAPAKAPTPPVAPPAPTVNAALPTPPAAVALPPKGATKAPSLAQQLGLTIRRVIIDPGHGGKDPGAIGIGGLQEKDVVLKVAKKAASKVASTLGVEVVLTRSSDTFIPLEERTALANARGGDLFLSIHANAARSAKAKGIETYFLDLADSEAEQGIAALENASSAHQVSDLQNILSSLMQNTKKDESARLASIVQDKLVTTLGQTYPEITNHGVKKAPFVVLIGAQMPSALTEIAFVSNPTEAKRLRTEAYLQALADSITEGVVHYASTLNVAGFAPTPPASSLLAAGDSPAEPAKKAPR